MRNLLDELTKLLDASGEFTGENGNLLKNKIIEYAIKLDGGLLKLLLKNEAIKNHFFIKVDDILVFDKIKFQNFVSNKQFLPDSFTAFKNKIGIADEKGDYISAKGDVTLVWPYKDCVLQGGQTKEDQKRDEIFWNETLAPDEIDRLLAPKVITSWKRFDKNGGHILTGDEKINFDKENYIIKGNNLIALHSIYKRFAGKIKLIYIDPPFNTGDDGFKYNDKFNHSTWLTFMKNRLEGAKKFLRKDGIICVHIGNEETSYLQLLLDEIFGRENYLNHITMTTNAPSGFKVTSAKIFSTANHLYFYSRNPGQAVLNKLYIEKEYDPAYKYVLLNSESHYSKWKWENIREAAAKHLGFMNSQSAIKEIGDNFEDRISDFAIKNAKNVFQTAAISGGAAIKRRDTIKRSENNREKVFVHPDEGENDFYILNGRQILFYDKRLIEADNIKVPGEIITDIWTDIGFTGIANEGGIILKNGKKPEKLLRRIVDMCGRKGDIVLDFFAGSGTLGAVAHKTGLQYVLIEQLDYIHELPEKRIINVINGDSTGISKSVNWKGGGSFIYCELMQWNEVYIGRVQKAKTKSDLKAIWNDMAKNAFLNYYIDINTINDNISSFGQLPVKDQKRFLIETLDKNQLYVDLSEIKDRDFKVSDTDKKLNALFYSEK